MREIDVINVELPDAVDEESDTATPPVEADGADKGTGTDERPITPRARVAVIVSTLATIGLLAAGVVLWQRAGDQADAADDRAAVLALAKRQSVMLTTVNPGNVKAQVKALLANATGEFRRQFDAATPVFAKVISEGKVVSNGTVAEAGVESLAEDNAAVLVAMNSTVRNSETGKDEPRNYRLRVELTKEADRWLVSNMHFVR